MIRPSISLNNRRARESGSAILAALGVLTVTLLLVAAAMFEARNRFRTSHHSSRWSQAGHAAEAGIEAALKSAHKKTWVADGWSAAPGVPGDAPISRTFTLSNGVPATGPITATVLVDTIASLSTASTNLVGSGSSSTGPRPWLRIRSTGRADVAGGAVAGQDTQDVLLRKMSLRTDRKTGSNVTAPHASRTVEVLAEEQPGNPFRYLFASRVIPTVRTHVKIDSYDSRDPAKSDFGPHSTYGIYVESKKQANGDLATMDSGTWDLNGANVDGDILTPTGNVTNANNVTGNIIDKFDFTFPDEAAPTWTTVTQNHGVVVNTDKTLEGGTKANPTRHKFTSISLTTSILSILTGEGAIRIKNPPGQTESWIDIWVTGDIKIDLKKQSGFQIEKGVHATIHFGGNMELDAGGTGGSAIRNDNELASTLLMRGYGGSSTDLKTITMKDTDLWAVVSAPWYKVYFDDPSMNIHGAFIAHQFDVTSLTKMHYDEALDGSAYGAAIGYKVRSWVEAVR